MPSDYNRGLLVTTSTHAAGAANAGGHRDRKQNEQALAQESKCRGAAKAGNSQKSWAEVRSLKFIVT
eukprot:1146305-Pelagomonas_calceolata.AAC.13